MAKKKSAVDVSTKERQSAEPKLKKVAINYVFPPDQTVAYSNNVTVQGDGSVYLINFFHVQAPMVVGSKEEQAKIIDQLHTIDAKCVSKVIIPEHLMAGLIEALQSNHQKKTEATNLQLN